MLILKERLEHREQKKEVAKVVRKRLDVRQRSLIVRQLLQTPELNSTNH